MCTAQDNKEALHSILKDRRNAWGETIRARTRWARHFETIPERLWNGETNPLLDHSLTTRWNGVRFLSALIDNIGKPDITNIGHFHIAIRCRSKKIFCSFLTNKDIAHFMRVEAETRYLYLDIRRVRMSNDRRFDGRVWLSTS